MIIQIFVKRIRNYSSGTFDFLEDPWECYATKYWSARCVYTHIARSTVLRSEEKGETRLACHRVIALTCLRRDRNSPYARYRSRTASRNYRAKARSRIPMRRIIKPRGVHVRSLLPFRLDSNATQDGKSCYGIATVRHRRISAEVPIAASKQEPNTHHLPNS